MKNLLLLMGPLLGLFFTLNSVKAKDIPPLSVQSQSLPDDFRTALFSAPVSARVMLNGKVLGDALILLNENNSIRLISFTDNFDSQYNEDVRNDWLTLLKKPAFLGACQQGCPGDLVALDYSLSNAQLSLVTKDAGQSKENQWHSLPEHNDTGLLLTNQFNLSASQGQTPIYNWSGDLESSIKNWTMVGRLQTYTTNDKNKDLNYSASSIYAQREMEGHFIRAGFFTPDNQGVIRAPNLRVGRSGTLIGIMAGTSDARVKSAKSFSLYPVYVTANREGVVEIYRDAALIDTQLLEPGLQLVDTTRLPSGIYSVELRVLEDGREVSRSEETIHKPIQWQDVNRRLRYSMFAGQQKSLASKEEKNINERGLTGGSLNYLLHSSVVGGLSLQSNARHHQSGLSLDWVAHDRLKLYGGVYQSNRTGRGSDMQGIWSHKTGNISVSHSRSLFRQEYNTAPRQGYSIQQSNVAVTQRFRWGDNITARASHFSGNRGVGYDLSYSTRTALEKTTINWQFSFFDRPYSEHSMSRNRGLALTTSFSFGQGSRHFNAGVGLRNDKSGFREHYATAALSQVWDKGPVKESSLGMTVDKQGPGFNTWNNIESQWGHGSIWGLSSTERQMLSGGMNFNSTVAIGKGHATLSQHGNQQGAGVIVNIISDDPDVSLVATHENGSHRLGHGKNYVPVNAWKAGNIEFDFPGTDDHGLKVWPSQVTYHLNRGGVAHHEIRVMKTLNILGRVIDKSGEPVGGAIIVNHAGKGVTEHDGIFTLSLSVRTPSVDIETISGLRCHIKLPPAKLKNTDKIILIGDLLCG